MAFPASSSSQGAPRGCRRHNARPLPLRSRQQHAATTMTCMKPSSPMHNLLLLLNEPSPSHKASRFSAPRWTTSVEKCATSNKRRQPFQKSLRNQMKTVLKFVTTASHRVQISNIYELILAPVPCMRLCCSTLRGKLQLSKPRNVSNPTKAVPRYDRFHPCSFALFGPLQKAWRLLSPILQLT